MQVGSLINHKWYGLGVVVYRDKQKEVCSGSQSINSSGWFVRFHRPLKHPLIAANPYLQLCYARRMEVLCK